MFTAAGGDTAGLCSILRNGGCFLLLVSQGHGTRVGTAATLGSLEHYHAAVSDFIKQLPALLGVMIGAFGSYVMVMRGDRARLRREHAARWQERQLAAYTDYALTLKKTCQHPNFCRYLGRSSFRVLVPCTTAMSCSAGITR